MGSLAHPASQPAKPSMHFFLHGKKVAHSWIRTKTLTYKNMSFFYYSLNIFIVRLGVRKGHVFLGSMDFSFCFHEGARHTYFPFCLFLAIDFNMAHTLSGWVFLNVFAKVQLSFFYSYPFPTPFSEEKRILFSIFKKINFPLHTFR